MTEGNGVEYLRTGPSRRTLFHAAGAALLLGPLRGASAQDTTPEQRLRGLGLELPPVSQPIANFVQSSRAGNLVYVSGQLPVRDGKVLYPGRVGVEVTPDQAKEAARLCALNVLAVAREACGGSLAAIRGCARLEGFVACVPSFTAQPLVMNGASDLFVAVLGDAGRHARFAVGVAALPLNAAVEVAAVFLVA